MAINPVYKLLIYSIIPVLRGSLNIGLAKSLKRFIVAFHPILVIVEMKTKD